MSGACVPHGFVKSVLQNGVGRYVCQLQRLTLKFCKSHGSSRGLRDFIENNLLEFTRSNPGTVVYLLPRRHRGAVLCAEYLNGNTIHFDVDNKTPEEICKWVEHLRTRSGHDIVRLDKMWHTDCPSIQGMWTPFTNKDTQLNITTFPDNENFKFVESKPSAQDQLIELAKHSKAENLAHASEPERSDGVSISNH